MSTSLTSRYYSTHFVNCSQITSSGSFDRDAARQIYKGASINEDGKENNDRNSMRTPIGSGAARLKTLRVSVIVLLLVNRHLHLSIESILKRHVTVPITYANVKKMSF